MLLSEDQNNRDAEIKAQVLRWIMGAVIGLNLCPFAAAAVRQKQLKILVVDGKSASTLLSQLIDEMLALDQEASAARTTLIVLDSGYSDFEEFLDLVGVVDGLLTQIGCRGRLQLAHFHPNYVFAGVDPKDQGNWTNRAPFPVLHLLREDDVEEATMRYPNADRIPADNVKRLQAMSLSEIENAIEGRVDA